MTNDSPRLLTPREVAGLFRVDTVQTIPGTSPTFPARLFSKIAFGNIDECWIWQAATNKGYGVIGRGSRGAGLISAHEAMWRLVYGDPPAGLVYDHADCDNPPCCNPSHGRYVTTRENVLRSNSMAARWSRRTSCKRGHPLDGVTQRTDGSRPCRYCKTCAREKMAARRRWAKSGRLPSFRTPGGHRRFYADQVEALLIAPPDGETPSG